MLPCPGRKPESESRLKIALHRFANLLLDSMSIPVRAVGEVLDKRPPNLHPLGAAELAAQHESASVVDPSIVPMADGVF